MEDPGQVGKTNALLLASRQDIVLLPVSTSLPSSIAALGVDGSGGGYRLRRARSGSASVAGELDVNGDKAVDLAYCEAASICRVVLGPPVTLATGWEISGFARGTRQALLAGGAQLTLRRESLAVTNDADLDGDGLADVVVADPTSVYVVRGRAAGFDPVDLQTFSDGYRIRAATDGTVTSIALIGDMNGDESPDLAIADETADDGAGRVYVVFSVPGG
ncbi:MAG TPA: VCBS repeat-containing protein [Polyangiales bacterium]|nr:VCBS repeat-containing protein [Polyangiales bacterium]